MRKQNLEISMFRILVGNNPCQYVMLVLKLNCLYIYDTANTFNISSSLSTVFSISVTSLKIANLAIFEVYLLSKSFDFLTVNHCKFYHLRINYIKKPFFERSSLEILEEILLNHQVLKFAAWTSTLEDQIQRILVLFQMLFFDGLAVSKVGSQIL